MQKFKVGFYEEVFKDGNFDFSEVKEVENYNAKNVARGYAITSYFDNMHELGSIMDWGEEDYSIVVQDEEGEISRFSIFVDFLYSFDVECSEIEITNIIPPLISHVSDVEAIEQK